MEFVSIGNSYTGSAFGILSGFFFSFSYEDDE